MKNKQHHKLPLYLHCPHLCDPLFIDDHTMIIKSIGKKGDYVCECTGCGLEATGNYKKHWMPPSVGRALMEYLPGIILRHTQGGFVYEQ